MSNKQMTLIFISLISLVGIIYGIFRAGAFSKELYNENVFTSIERSPVVNGIDEEQLKTIETEKYLILYSKNDEGSIKIKDNVQKILEYIKKPYKTVEVKEFEGLKDRTNAVIVCFEDLETLPRLEEIFSYVKKGGSMLFAQRPVNEALLQKYHECFGIEKSKLKFIQTKGIQIVNDILLGADNYKESSAFINNSSLNIKLGQTAEVYAKDGSGLPLLWKNHYEDGNIVFFNGTMFNDSGNRGLFLGAISLTQPEFLYPIVNAKVNFIDDFPSPAPYGKAKKVYDGMDMDTAQFYRMIWWPDMLRTAKTYNLKYSGAIIETYNNKVEATFTEEGEGAGDALFFFGKELLNNEGEMGIHGYNHQSLTYDKFVSNAEDYKVWKNEADVKAGLDEVNRFAHKLYPKYDFRSYVPPSNILDQDIRKHFTELYPDIKIISSLYISNNFDNRYVQEFEVAKDGITEFPRFTSGYMPKNSDWWDIYNGISLHGIISHFVHPDDVLNTVRSDGKSWEEMYRSYDKLWETVFEKYKWMRPMTISEAAEELKKFLECKTFMLKDQDTLYCYAQNFRKDMYFILRTEKKPLDVKGCSLKKLDKNVYLVYTQKPKFSIRLEEVGKK